MSKLTLLGIWNILPLTVWPWLSDKAIKHFYRLTKYQLKSFTYLRNELHHEYFIGQDIERLRKNFEILSEGKKVQYVQRICNDYYLQAKRVSKLLKQLEKTNGKLLTNTQLIKSINHLSKVLSSITMQIWFVVLLDVWYPKLTNTSSFKRIGARARDHSGNLHNRAKKLEKGSINEVAKRIKIPKADLYYLFPQEVAMALRDKHTILSKIKLRKKLLVTINIRGKYRIYEGPKAKLLLKKYMSAQRKKKTNILIGLPAHPGKCRGTVRKILLHSEFKKFKQDEILVVLQTLVDFLPIMKKSRAILTEFGGITSHAAVVSRELKKPCIVGIAHLTTSLKDGDRVEIDSTRGIVKKL